MIAIILHERDKLLVEELVGTTETQTGTGVVTYHTAIKNRDHRTDSLRACMRAILTLEAEAENYAEANLEDTVGFMDLDVKEDRYGIYQRSY